MSDIKRPPVATPAAEEESTATNRENTPTRTCGLPPIIDGDSRDPIRVTGAKHLTQILEGKWLGRKGLACCPSCGGGLTIRQGNETTIFVCCHSGCTDREIFAAMQDRGLILGMGKRS